MLKSIIIRLLVFIFFAGLVSGALVMLALESDSITLLQSIIGGGISLAVSLISMKILMTM